MYLLIVKEEIEKEKMGYKMVLRYVRIKFFMIRLYGIYIKFGNIFFKVLNLSLVVMWFLLLWMILLILILLFMSLFWYVCGVCYIVYLLYYICYSFGILKCWNGWISRKVELL